METEKTPPNDTGGDAENVENNAAAETAKKPPPDSHADEPQPVPETLETAVQKIAELNDQLLRALAELENTRRRAARDHAEALKYGGWALARDMLGAVDNLQRALKAIENVPQDKRDEIVDTLLEGVAATERDLLAGLARHKVAPINPLGDKFDPNCHEALFETPGTEKPPGTVIEVVEVGYMMEGRLLRPAKVGIAKD